MWEMRCRVVNFITFFAVILEYRLYLAQTDVYLAQTDVCLAQTDVYFAQT
jgi:hypothetical protein